MEKFLANYIFIVSMLLFAIGFALLIFNKNLIKKIIGLDIMDSGTYLFLASMGYIKNANVPIISEDISNAITNANGYVNPIPSGLVLTGIVVSVSVSAIMLALSIRLYKKYHTLELDKIYLYEKSKIEKGE